MKDKRNILTVVISVLCVILLTAYGPRIVKYDFITMLGTYVKTNSTLEQDIIGIRAVPNHVYSVYYGDKMIGRLSSMDEIQPMLDKVYEERYAEEFPNTKIYFNQDIHIAKELSFFVFEDIDSTILEYLKDDDNFAVEVTKISLSNGAEFYVKNFDDFTAARDKYVLNFISAQGYTNIQNKIETPALTEYGSKELNITIQESVDVSTGYAPYDKILKNVDEVVYYLSYGYDTVPEYYTVQKYDTVEGVARQYGLQPEHIVMINSDKIKSIEQILTVGTELNVTYYNSPLTIVVQRQRLYEEIVYPEKTQYIYDNTLAEGQERYVQYEKDGTADVLMLETYVNGVLIQDQSYMISSTVTVAPQREIKRIGTKVIPGVGTGKFRWPVDNPRVTCRWGCYSGHKAVDIINRYSNYGKVYASDRGVVSKNSYDSISGYYVRINHNNGYITHYGHLRYKSNLTVGAKIDKGDVIGTIGATGYTTGPHVHFAMWKNGVRVNPCNYLGC